MGVGTLIVILLILGLLGNRRDREIEHEQFLSNNERAKVDAEYRMELARKAKANGVKIMEKNRKSVHNPLSWKN